MKTKTEIKKESNQEFDENDKFILNLVDVNDGMDLTKLDGRE